MKISMLVATLQRAARALACHVPQGPHAARAIAATVVMAAWALLPDTAIAQSCTAPPGGPPCAGSSVASTGGSGAPYSGAGNPINVITGNKYQREEDMPALPGVLGLEIVRHYNSAYGKPGYSNGSIGRGWRLSYETELFDKYGKIQILQADGRRIIFDRDPKAPGLCTTANPGNGGLALQRTPNGLYEYTWTWTDGSKLHFNSWGKLDRITAPTGESVQLLYDRLNVLVRVIDPQGRSLNLVYFDPKLPNHFHGMQFIDSPVGRFEYEYGSTLPKDSGLFDKAQLLANLVRVRLPTDFAPDKSAHALTSRGTTTSRISRIYHHEDPRSPWVLTGISVETIGTDNKPVKTRFSTYGYDGNARAILSTHAGNVGKVMLDTSESGKTVLTNSLGQKTTYLHATIAGEYRLLEVRGAGCASCGETNVRYGYNYAGQLIESTKLTDTGTPLATTRTELDKRGRTVKVSKIVYQHGKPGPAQMQIRFEYQGDKFAPVVIARPSVVTGKEALTRIEYNDAGQPLSVTETGWTPATSGSQTLARIERTTSYRYVSINGRSLLAQIDGPLPNGKTNSPVDSDITLIEYDNHINTVGAPKAAADRDGLNQYERHDGIVTAIITPGYRKSMVQYDGAGRIATIRDAEGRTTTLRYSPRGLLLALIRDGITHATAYDEFDNPTESGYSLGSHYQALARIGYDSAGRNTWTASPLGIVATKRFDTEGQLLDEATLSSTIKRKQSYTYDQLGRPLTVTEANGGTWRIGWNTLGLPDELTDTLGRVARFGYDAAGKIIAVTEAANMPQPSLNKTDTRFELDVHGHPKSVIAPNGAITSYTRDDFGQTLATVGADSGMTTRRFDAAGRLVASTDANDNRATYEYDVMGRIARQIVTHTSSGGKKTVTTWRYEGPRLVAIDNPEQAERYGYDAQGRLIAKTVILALAGSGHISNTTSYSYDALGQLAGASLPDGSMLDYQRNGQNQVTALERNLVRTAWLRWLLPSKAIVKNLERDVVGLKHLTYGNGIEARYQRSKEGELARIVYLDPRGPASRERRSAALETLMGISPALAAPTPVAPRLSGHATLPGALGLPRDPKAVLDHRYLWDVQGNLLHTQDKDGASSYAYDARDRLIAVATAAAVPTAANASVARYHYDNNGNRLLAQEGIADQSDTRSNTIKTSYAPAADRLHVMASDDGSTETRYDSAGQPDTIGNRTFVWDALGHLLEVRQDQRILARYRYNHRGERIEKTVGSERTYYLYEDRKLVAELDAKGAIRRQYVYLADQPVAVIDTPDAGSAYGDGNTALARFTADIATIWHAWFDNGENIAYLQNNHLGATEVVTDAKGNHIWQASYTPFGTLVPTGARGKSTSGASRFELNLRLPGQYADRETGLYYNDHRYYDPARGRYLTPDPMGLRAGANSYAYVNGNPLKYTDSTGLILFAFDGTGNGAKPTTTTSLSNVQKFLLAYNQDINGEAYYITGIGTKDKNMPVEGSMIDGTGFDDRVALAFTNLNTFVDTVKGEETVNIDVVGYSRGAAEARVWMNQLVSKLAGGRYKSQKGNSRCLNLRFEGLWDTVSHLGAFSGNDANYNFTIPPEVKYVAQAVALNEHRGGPANFDARSIFNMPVTSSIANRNEQGFVGSHADIGGGYATGDLSNVALMWIIKQGSNQGIKFKNKIIEDANWDTIASPILHDKSANTQTPAQTPQLGDRNFIYGNDTQVKQGKAIIGGNDTTWAKQFVNYYAHECGPDGSPAVGLVNLKEYEKWLIGQGITMNYAAPVSAYVCN